MISISEKVTTVTMANNEKPLYEDVARLEKECNQLKEDPHRLDDFTLLVDF